MTTQNKDYFGERLDVGTEVVFIRSNRYARGIITKLHSKKATLGLIPTDLYGAVTSRPYYKLIRVVHHKRTLALVDGKIVDYVGGNGEDNQG